MIRKQVGEEMWLITQHDHALLSGWLAKQFGAGGYAAPQPGAVRGIALHDCGWPLHDDERPTLNERGLPLDVFESPPGVAAVVWPEGSRRAAQEDPYAGLLVSLHVLSLSVIATSPPAGIVNERFDLGEPSTRFQINRFQQQQIELQEELRQRLGMRIDEPRRAGLAEQSNDPREKQLIYDFRLLQAMDKLSLSICCTKPPFQTIEPLLTHPGGVDRPLRVTEGAPFRLTVSPWPFIVDQVRGSVPFKRLAARSFENEHTFRNAYGAAGVEQFEFVLAP